MSKFPPSKLFVISVVISFGGSFHFGYQLVLTNPSQNAFITFLNDSFALHYGSTLENAFAQAAWSAVVAVLFVGAIVGSLSLGCVGEKLGRKRGLYFSFTMTLIAAATSIVSLFVCFVLWLCGRQKNRSFVLAQKCCLPGNDLICIVRRGRHSHATTSQFPKISVISFELYALSRVLTGYSLSLSLGLSALYLNESSPKECRGFVSMMIGVMVQLGTVVASVVAMPSLLGTTQNLWYLYLLECITLICVIVTLPFMPESPGYLGLRGDDAAARSSIMFLHGCEPSQAEVILCEIKENLKQNAKALSVSEVWRQKQTRQGTIVGIAVSLSMSFSGIAVVNAYAVEILRGCGLSLTDASLGNILLAVVSLLAIVISSFVVDRFGRRPLILVSSTVILVLNLAIFGLMYAFNRFHHTWTGYVLVVVISIFIIFFAIGPGPLCYFITAEMVDQNARAAAQSWASFTQMACRTVLLTIYLPIVHQIGQALAYLALFVVPLVLAVLFLYFNMPETKNKNYNEVLEATANLPSISKIFRSKPPATELHIPVEHSESSRTIEKF